jgi:hypothetical protein
LRQGAPSPLFGKKEKGASQHTSVPHPSPYHLFFFSLSLFTDLVFAFSLLMHTSTKHH